MREQGTIKRGQFFGTLFVCLLVLAAANLVVQRLTANTVSRRILADARSAREAQVIALGNSLVRSGFDAGAFVPPDAAKGMAVNLAMGASTPPEQLLLLRAGLRAEPKARLLLYGFYDFQLTEPIEFANAEIIGNHDILYYQEPEFARGFYRMGRYESVQFEITRRAPMLAERGAVWAKVELLRRAMGQQGMPAEARNQFGRAADFTMLEAKSREEFERHCVAAARAPLNAPVAEMVREAQEKNVSVVFVLMPLPPHHVQTFYESAAWAEYEVHVRSLLDERKVAYVNASRWIPDAGKFSDALHLSEDGAQEFSRRLGAVCADRDAAHPCETQ